MTQILAGLYFLFLVSLCIMGLVLFIAWITVLYKSLRPKVMPIKNAATSKLTNHDHTDIGT